MNQEDDETVNEQQQIYIRRFWEQIKEAAEELRGQALPQLLEEDFFLFKETGNRLIYEGKYFGRRKFLTVFGILAEFEGKPADMDKLAEIILEICKERFWALPAHVNFETLDENTIDLFAAETAGSLAEIVWLLKDRLPQKVIDIACEEVIKRVLIPFCTKKPPYCWWEVNTSNWAAVCAGSVGMAAIYMDWMSPQVLVELPKDWKKHCIDRVCKAMQCYLNGIEEDGVCIEGLGYFSYGMMYYAAFAELLEQEKAKSKDCAWENLMYRSKCDKAASFQQKCYFGKGVSLSFSDGSSTETFLPGLTAYLQYCYKNVEAPDYSNARDLEGDSCYRWVSNERNICWLIKYGGDDAASHELQEEKCKEKIGYDFFPYAQWMIVKDKQGNGYAAKGGHNAEHHNHNDVGHFLCVYHGEMLFVDLGAGEYTRDYFGSGRYQILCNRSLGHSVPLINGLEQHSGKEFHANSFIWDGQKKELQISFAGAYQDTETADGMLDKLERTIYIETENIQNDDMRIQIRDLFVTTKATDNITENLITGFIPVVDGNGVVTIAGKQGCCKLSVYIQIDGMTDTEGKTDSQESMIQVKEIDILPKVHYLHDGQKTIVYLIQWEVPCAARIVSCHIDMKFQTL